MANAAKVIEAYWATCEARDWDRFSELLAEDVVYELPQTRERIRGRPAYLEFNATYPGDWHVSQVRVIGDGRHASSWTTFHVDGGQQTGLCFFDLDDQGLITHITDFWPTAYDPPPGREHLTEIY